MILNFITEMCQTIKHQTGQSTLTSHQKSVGDFDNDQKNSKKLFSPKFLHILIPLLSLTVLAVLFSLYINKTRQETNSSKGQKLVQEITPEPTQITPTPVVKNLVLKKDVNGQSQVVFSLCENCSIDYVAYLMEYVEQGNDWLFYPTFENNGIQIKGYDLKTNKIKTIYDLNENQADFQGGEGDLPTDIWDMQIIDNTLFFSFGGYFTQGATFWVDLTAVAEPHKIADAPNAKIVFWEDRYWIIGGGGDGCAGFTDYSLIDLATKEANHITTIEVGCDGGEEYIGIDKKDRMLVAFCTWQPPPVGREDEGDEEEKCQYVIAIPLSNPSLEEGVIAKQEMPADISSIEYLKDSDQLLLVGKGEEEYLYDFSSKLITKVDTPVPTPIPSPGVYEKFFGNKINNTTVEDRIKDLNLHLPSGYRLVWE